MDLWFGSVVMCDCRICGRCIVAVGKSEEMHLEMDMARDNGMFRCIVVCGIFNWLIILCASFVK